MTTILYRSYVQQSYSRKPYPGTLYPGIVERTPKCPRSIRILHRLLNLVHVDLQLYYWLLYNFVLEYSCTKFSTCIHIYRCSSSASRSHVKFSSHVTIKKSWSYRGVSIVRPTLITHIWVFRKSNSIYALALTRIYLFCTMYLIV